MSKLYEIKTIEDFGIYYIAAVSIGDAYNSFLIKTGIHKEQLFSIQLFSTNLIV